MNDTETIREALRANLENAEYRMRRTEPEWAGAQSSGVRSGPHSDIIEQTR